MIEYYYADLNHYAVAGTPNRLEYDQGFFVKYGDGAADFKPIAHLYKSQVFQLAEYLGVPQEIQRRVPTTDTYSLAQTQEEVRFLPPARKNGFVSLWKEQSHTGVCDGSGRGHSRSASRARLWHDRSQTKRNPLSASGPSLNGAGS